MKHHPLFVAKTSSGICRVEPTTFLDSPLRGEEKEELYRQKEGLLDEVLVGEQERNRISAKVINKVVYDNVLPVNGIHSPSNSSLLRKRLKSRKSKKQKSNILKFDSQFESGNLRRAVQIYEYEYDLMLSYDTNSRGHTQWFYFSIDNVRKDVKYKFNIINFLKGDSLFNYGMKPCIYSEFLAKRTKKGWHRHGFFDIIYYQNTLRVGKRDKYFYTLTFSIIFPHITKYYVSFSYPYSYTRLCKYLFKLEQLSDRKKYIKKKTLCKTLAGNNCHCLTITNFSKTSQSSFGRRKKKKKKRNGNNNSGRKAKTVIKNDSPFGHPFFNNNNHHPQDFIPHLEEPNSSRHHLQHVNSTPSSALYRTKFKQPTISHLRRNGSTKPVRMMKKRGIVLTARVHPGETPSSFIMKGIIDFLTSKRIDAKILREHFIFKIVPMLNPDGVIVGNYRCSLAGVDLNRKWRKPSKKLHPSIYWTKMMTKKLMKDHNVALFCDFHSHSRHKNVFMYGCDGANGSLKSRVFPRILSRVCKNFSFQDCSFEIRRRKKNTGRVVMFKELGVPTSYCLEASFCGSNFGKFHSHHFTQKDYEKLGHSFCKGLVELFDPEQAIVREIQEELMVMYACVDTSIFSLFGPGEGVERKDGFLYKKRAKKLMKKKKKKNNLKKKKNKKKKKKKKSQINNILTQRFMFHPIPEQPSNNNEHIHTLVSRFPKLRFDDDSQLENMKNE